MWIKMVKVHLNSNFPSYAFSTDSLNKAILYIVKFIQHLLNPPIQDESGTLSENQFLKTGRYGFSVLNFKARNVKIISPSNPDAIPR